MTDAISYRCLGRTALRVSPLCLGTMNFGSTASQATSHAILDRALDAGVTFVDTADQYGGEAGVGTTETIIGRWLANDSSRRDRIVLATKVHEPMSDEPNDRGLSARHIRLACDASLRRLGTDHIDLYQMHHLDRSAHWDEIWQAMETLIAMGKISYVGSSNFPGWSIAQANEAARRRHGLGIVSEQSLYNLVERTIELEVFPASIDYGVGVLAWSPLAGGLLGGVLDTTATKRRSTDAMRARIEAHRPQLEQWEALCSDLGQPPAVVALAWLAQRPGMASVIVGPRTVEQFDDAVASMGLELDDATLDRLDEIWPGPGPAPEAYAW
jgi:aryl-alcohol dehydrogenase-like predicted oxidoreductase